MVVSGRERSFLARIGELKARSHVDATAAHLELSLTDRMKRSWELFETFRRDTAQTRRRDESQSAFYARARALGLYRRH